MELWLCIVIAVIAAVVGAALGALIGSVLQKRSIQSKLGRTEEAANKILADAKDRAEVLSKERISEAKEEVHRLRSECEADCRERRSEVTKMEKRVLQREEQIDKKIASLEEKEERFAKREKELEDKLTAAEELYTRRSEALEKVAGMSSDEAKQELMERVEQETRHDCALMVRDIEAQTKTDADKIARNIIAGAIQRCAADHVAETTVSVVALPNDDMKGRIIGREGRNIKAIETATGVELIIDDTPEAVILSSFDPIRREIARVALERLIVDGRIHPTRIEDMVDKARREVEQQIKEAGESAVFDAGIHNIHPEMVKILGRLKYRTSYGQNVLKHSLEVSYIAGLLAGEIGANVALVKRAGLLHDIGKAVDHEVEGTHIQIGVDIAKKYRENPEVIHCIASHHNDIEPQTVEAVLIQAADAISGARPGARRETLEAYIKRLEQLEEIANSFEGVDKSFAVQAGREIRIIVKPEVVTEEATVLMAKEIAKRIETDMVYPGQIKVNVVRETRKVEFAK